MAWELFDRDGAAGFKICGVDGDALAGAPIATLPIACEISIGAESAAPAVLEATERDLELVTASLGGRLVATARTRTSLTTLVYLPTDSGADGFTRISLPKGATVSVAPAIDPTWSLFVATRPHGIEEQSMLDFRVRNQLHQAGDTGGERPIRHIVTGLTGDTVDDFMGSVSAALVTVRGDAVGDGASPWRLTHVADLKDVTESSWIIRQIGERFGATYDGWGSAVISGTERSVRAGRRLFRRPQRR
jgi:hypothetical protein